MHQSLLSPRVGGPGIPRGFDEISFPVGGFFDTKRLPTDNKIQYMYDKFDKTCCPRGGEFDKTHKQNVKYPWVCPAPLPWGLTLTGALVTCTG